MNDDSCLDCSDIPCNDCGYPRGDCHCTPEQVESAHYSLQHTQLAIAALSRVLGRQPVGVELTESIMASFEAELQQYYRRLAK